MARNCVWCDGKGFIVAHVDGIHVDSVIPCDVCKKKPAKKRKKAR
jgi:hypothetical protein